MDTPLYGLATDLTPLAVLGPVSMQQTPSASGDFSITTPVLASGPLVPGPAAVVLDQRPSTWNWLIAGALAVAAIGFALYGDLRVAARERAGSAPAPAAAPPIVPVTEVSATPIKPEAASAPRLRKADVSRALPAARQTGSRGDEPANEALADTLERLRKGIR
jgi:hypothetical protein